MRRCELGDAFGGQREREQRRKTWSLLPCWMLLLSQEAGFSEGLALARCLTAEVLITRLGSLVLATGGRKICSF